MCRSGGVIVVAGNVSDVNVGNNSHFNSGLFCWQLWES